MSGFVCIYYGNTGSSWLLAALGSSPEVLVPGFEPIEPWAWDADAAVKLAWLEAAMNPPSDRAGHAFAAWSETIARSPQVRASSIRPSFRLVGLKMSRLAVSHTDEVADIVDRSGSKVILLVRRNRIKHALSLYRYHDEEKSQFHLKESYPPTTVDLRRFDEWMSSAQQLHDRSEQIRAVCLDRLGPDRVFDVAYEEFVDDAGKRDVTTRLAAFLGIPDEFGDGQYQKATPDDLRSAVTNFRRLWLRYVFTRYRRDLRR